MTYEELTAEIEELTRTYHAFAIAIEGLPFSGKRALAAHLSKVYGAPVIHMDDFRYPKTAGNGAAAEMDFERFNEEISEPWLKKGELVYSIYDKESGEIKERLALPNAQIYIIEGNYVWHPGVSDFYDFRLFLKAPQDLRALLAKTAGAEIDFAKDETLKSYYTEYFTEELADAVLGEEFRIPADEEEPENDEADAEKQD